MSRRRPLLQFGSNFISGLFGGVYLSFSFSCLLKEREGRKEREEILVKPTQDHLDSPGYKVTFQSLTATTGRG